jgi:cob(I)alamin adenosyltransferase
MHLPSGVDDQRQRLIDAMVQLAGERGYAATTVTDLIGPTRSSADAPAAAHLHVCRTVCRRAERSATRSASSATPR